MPSSCLSEAALSTAVADRASSPTDEPAPLTSVASVAAPRGSLGLSSYSLYLTHAPILIVVYEMIVASHVAPGCSRLPRHGLPWLWR